MTQRARVSWWLAAAGAGAGLLLGYGLARPGSPDPAAPAETSAALVTSTETSAAPPPSASASAESSPTDDLALAREGDLAALKRLELLPPADRSRETALALHRGHVRLAEREAATLLADLRADPSLLSDASTMMFAARLALDPEVAPELLAGLVELEGPIALDLVHDLARSGSRGSRLELLARDLLRLPKVRARASKALATALALEDQSACDEAANALLLAVEHADERALPVLRALEAEKGCGADKLADCFPCLRDEPHAGRLRSAMERAQKTPFAPVWRASRQQRKPVE